MKKNIFFYKKYSLIVFGLILFLILGVNVNAAGEIVNMSSPISFGNYSTLVNVSINTNLIINSSSYNVTLYCNKSGGSIATRTGADIIPIITLTNSTPAQYIFENASVRINNIITAVNESRTFNCSAYADNLTTQFWSNTGTLSASNVTFDSTPPNVTIINPSNGNFSGTIILNASINDVTIGINSSNVYFNVTYPNGTQLNFTRASALGIYYYISLITPGFIDGKYNVTTYAYDLLNNLNKTQMISVTFDNTPPSGSESCSPSIAYKRSTVSCSCSGSDATSGVSSISYNSNPDTSLTGTFTPPCVIIDYAGNSVSVSTLYSIISPAGAIKPIQKPSSTTPPPPSSIPNSSTASSAIPPSSSAPSKQNNLLGLSYWIWIIIIIVVLAGIIYFFIIKNKKFKKR